MNLGLYITFILVGALLFGFVYVYSVREQNKRRKSVDEQIDDLVDHNSVDHNSADNNIDHNVDHRVDQKSVTANFETDSELKPSMATPVKPALQPSTKSTIENTQAATDQSTVSTSNQQADKREVGRTPEVRPMSEKPPLSANRRQQPIKEGVKTSHSDDLAIPVPDLSEPYAGDAYPLGVAREQENPNFSNSDLHIAASNDNVDLKDVNLGDNDLINNSDNGVLYESSSSSQADDAARVEPSFQTPKSESPAVAQEPSKQHSLIDKKISELVAKIPGITPVSRDEVLTIFRKYDYLLARKIQVFGVNSLTGAWSDLELESEATTYTDLGVSVQLADTTGALTRKELNAMSQMILELSDTFDRKFNFSMDLDEAIEHGRELDRIARAHCAMVVLNIVPKRRQGFRSSDFESCSRDLTMTQAANGVFTRYRRKGSGDSIAQYHIAVADEKGKFRSVNKQQPFYITDIVVYLNVPRTKEPLEVFDNMLEESRRLATWLDGKLVDKQRRNLTTKMVRQFRDQIGEMQRAMQADGLTPGDSISQKLF